MSEKIKINWTLNVQVAGGPKISASETTFVDAYDKIEITVAADGTTGQEVQVQPGDAGQVQFLLIRSDAYGETLSYSVNATDSNRIKLDALQLLIGDGAVGLLGNSPNKLYFYNNLGKDVSIHILVGRKAT